MDFIGKYTLEVLFGSTCPIRSNRVLWTSISLIFLHRALFQHKPLYWRPKYPKSHISMSVVSIINQLRTAPKSNISLLLKRTSWSSKGSKSPLVLHDITQRPRILFDWLKGYRYLQICHTNIATASTMSVYPAQFPHSLLLFTEKGAPKSGCRIKQTQTRNPKSKAIKANKVSM